MTPDRKAFELVYEDLDKGNELTFTHVGEVFGQDFWILLVYALLDAHDAARAIQNAMNRLKVGGKEDMDESPLVKIIKN